MKNLLSKELRLAASPLSYLFLPFAAMTMIPGYPILLGSFFVCLGLFQSFQSSREANDILYTVLLPVEKRDAVRAKYIFVCFLEGVAWVVMAALTLLRMTALSAAPVYVNNVMMNANLVYLGFAAVIFGLFNGVFVGGFFQTGYKFGKPFVMFIVVTMVVVMIGEFLHHVPGLEFLNGNGRLPLQALLLLAGLAVFGLVTLLSCRRAEESFEHIDL